MEIFLSLSFADAAFVKAVHERLPRGVARYFEQSFERGENLITAMERGLNSSQIFVLFATEKSLASYAVQFEMNEARRLEIFGKIKRVLVFPIEPRLDFSRLPSWLQSSWIPNAGENPADIARFLTTVLLEPDAGLLEAAPTVVGRGAGVDAVRRLYALHLQRHRTAPNVFVFPGITGIGRKTFASYYIRNGLGAEANLPYGPTITLSAQAELVDLYRALRTEIDPRIPTSDLTADQNAFSALSDREKTSEIVRVMGHFTKLQQAITVVSPAGFFEDAAKPKYWVEDFLSSIPNEQKLLVISNLQFQQAYVDRLGNAIQYRVPELSSEDVGALMIFTANLLGLEEFTVPEALLGAIGGHPDVANAAVRLAHQKGLAILERDPRQLFNVQRTIIGELVNPDSLSSVEQVILDVLGWLPYLGSDLLEKIVIGRLGYTSEDFEQATESLIVSCLIYATNYRYSIAPSVRQLYRRYNVTNSETLKAMSATFSEEWITGSDQGFRDDLFSAFVFMHVLDGKALPPELRKLLTPSNLYEVVRDAYARGKSTENSSTIEQAIEWGKVAFDMKMAESLREEVLSVVARAQVRLDRHKDAAQTIKFMSDRGYRQAIFLEGHSLRKRRKFDEAIPKLRFVLEHNRGNKAALHELAICYRRLRRYQDLEGLLKQYQEAVDDSPEFLDFTIALKISRGDLSGIATAIARLRHLDETSNRADLRQAQYLSRQNGDNAAFRYLTDILSSSGRGSARLRAARAVYGAKIGKTREAREDLAMIKAVDRTEGRFKAIEVQIMLAEGRRKEAYEFFRDVQPQEPGDWLLLATVLEAAAGDPGTGLAEAGRLKQEASEIRARYAKERDFVFYD